MLKNLEGVVGAVGGAVTTNGGATIGLGGDQTTQTTPTKPRKRNPAYATTQQLISLAVAARDEAAAHPTAKNKALREAAYMRVIVACERMIHRWALMYKSPLIDNDDLTAAATLGLLEALNRFDASKCGGGWTRYLGQWMRWKLQQFTGSRDASPEVLMIDDHGTGNIAALLNGAAYEMQSSHRARQEGAE